MVADEQVDGAGVSIEISVLGTVAVRRGDDRLHVPRGRPRILLAVLALEVGRPVTVGRLLEYLWEEDLPVHPRAALQNNVRRLRGIVGAEAIRTLPDGYQLDVPPDRVDAHRFRRLADDLTGDRHGGRDPATVEAIDRVLALWHHDPLADTRSPALVRDYTPALFERYVALAQARADAHRSAGRHARAIADLRELTARLPLQESLWARLLRALRDAGRTAEALEGYERIRATLADELGTDPGPELRELHVELLTAPDHGRATTDPTDPADPVAGAEAADATAVGKADTPRQVPPGTACFVGRDGESTRLAAVWDASPRPPREAEPESPGGPIGLAVIHGPGGIGKTELAVSWAHRMRGSFPDGQLHIDLRGHGPAAPLEPHSALGMLLRSLGVPGESLPARTVERSGLLRTQAAGRRLLLLLDNARDADQVRPLLPGSDAVVLVTSRNRLRELSIREGAVTLGLSELPERDARALLGRVLGTDRVTDAAAAVDRLVGLCGGNPLALRIAAERCSRYPDTALGELVDELAEELRTPTRAETGEHGSSSNLARNLSTVFSWSYHALPPAAARLFRRLGWFPARTVGSDAAAVLLDSSPREAAALLETLVDVHLVDEPCRGRFQQHDLLRAYAAERFDAEESVAERESLLRRLADWYLHAATAANRTLAYSRTHPAGESLRPPGQPLPTFADRATTIRWLETEHTALLGIAEQAAEHGLDEQVWQLGWAMRDVLDLCGYDEERLTTGELGLAAAERTGRSEAIRYAAFALGGACADLGRHDRGEEVLQLALRHTRASGDERGVPTVLSVLGLNQHRAGNARLAYEYHDRAIAEARRLGDDKRLAPALLNSGAAATAFGDSERAIAHTRGALEHYAGIDAPLHQAIALDNLADAERQAGELDAARQHAEHALTLLRGLGAHRNTANALETLGHILARAEGVERAAEAWREALTLTASGDPLAAEIRSALADVEGRPAKGDEDNRPHAERLPASHASEGRGP